MKDKLLEKVAEKVAKKKLEKETGGIIDKEPDGKESDGESDGEGRGQIKSKWLQFKRKFSRSRSSSKNEKDKDKKKKKKSSSDEESEASEDDEDAMDRLGLKDAAPDAKFGTERFDDADKKGTWNVLVRVIEGKDLPPGALRVRAKLDGRQKATRTCTEGVPRWRQNLCFSLKNMTLEKLAAENLTLNVTSVGRIRERVGATFSVLMSAVLHSKNRSVLSKWVALHSPNDSDEEEDESSENCGFIKVSLCIYGTTDGPPHMNDDMHSDEVWSGAQLEDHTIRIRIFRLHHIAEDICDKVHKNKKKKPFQFIVRVHLGKLVMETGGREMVPYSTSILTSDAISLEQEMYLPIQWPTVIQKIRFELIMKQGSRKRVLGQASIPLRFLYEPGEDGFMPTFGPAYINFYGHEALQRLKWRNEKNPIDELSGSKYLGRLLCSLDCVDYNGDSSMIAEMGHGPLSHSKSFEEGHRYSLFCSFTAANLINPLFASKPVSFHVSMGEHGSTGYTAHDYRASTFAAMPDTDKHKYFFMPWGNHRPTAEVACLWEDVSRRMARHNAINQVAAMISELMKETTKGGNMAGETASLCIEALDNAEELLDRLSRIPEPSQMTTELDRLWEETRRRMIMDTADSLEVLRWEEADTADEAAEKTVRMLARLRETALKLAEEVQVSLPAIIIKMLAGEQVVGYAKINPADVFYNDNDALSGEWCGKVKTVNLKWPTLVNRKNRKEEFPGVVHVRMWFGLRKDVSEWQEMIQPAEIKSFLEVFVHQKKKLNRQWKKWNGPVFSDEHGATNMEVAATRETFGYVHLGNWVSRTSHDMWICKDLDRPTFVERVYEVHKRGKEDWKFERYTDYYGGDLDISMKAAPKGWEWTEKWAQDKHTNHGDKNGWVYALHDQFWGEAGTVDKEERAAHQYRRRCIARTRRKVEYNREFEDLAKYEQRLGDQKWEFAANFKAAWHSSDIADASVRRRRFLVEVEREKELPKGREHENYFLPRLFEIHGVTTTWQLRCYLLWAKDLLPVVKNSAHAFVRVTFLTRAQQSIVVANSQNPIWSETLIFDRMPIPGGKRQIVVNPPTIIVEVRGERNDDSEMFLGRFEAQPLVVCSPSDQRVQPQWHQLCFPKGKTRGAVLAAFELFYITPGVDNLPLEPMKKEKVPDKFEVPAEMKPKFERYAMQFLCWGVRNLSRYQLLSVKKPFVEMLIGDNEVRSDVIENASKNPNFSNPIINIQEVELPAALELSPPMVLNLHDRRAFKRQPIVGVATIADFTKYIFDRKIKIGPRSSKGKDEFDKMVDGENQDQASWKLIDSIQKEGEPPIDWWSKYYASQGMNGKAPGFEESGMERLSVFNDELEKVNGYNNFSDFLDTFTLYKCSKGNFDDPEEKEKMGELKGKLFITRLTGNGKAELPDPPGVEFTGTTRVLLRIYVVEARGLVSTRRSGLCDPYIVVRCGKGKVNLKKNYRPDTLEPVFGELIEMEVTVPVEKDLTVTLMDRRRILADDEIGSTTIDMENRLLTKWRGTVGLSRQYTVHGELAWRDQVSPLTALQRYCAKMMIDPPLKLTKRGNRGIRVLGVDFWYSDVEKLWNKEDKKWEDNERRRAGKDEEDEKSDKSEKKTITKEPGKEDDEKGKVSPKSPMSPGEKADKKESMIGGWGDAGEDSRTKATFGRKKEDAMTMEDKLKIRRKQREKLVGRPMQCVALHILNLMNLVPEHVETRTLKSPLGQNVSCGEVRLFVDMFPMGIGAIPAPLDISPRQPDKYQLRVAVLNVSDAIPVKRSFGTPTADLYVKVFVNGQQKTDKTDIHYGSTDGLGEFNWRFLLNVDYNPWEKKVVAYRKTRLFRKPREELVEPLVIVQLWDKNKWKKDTLLGEMAFDITEFNEGLTEPDDIAKYTRRRKLRSCCCGCCSLSKKCCLLRCFFFCKDTRCCLKLRKNREEPMPKAPVYEHEDPEDSVSLFETRSLRGWWPMLSNEIKDSQKEDVDAKKKKDDDYDPDALYVMGLVELEMQLLPLDEAEADPVGKKRKDPNHSPHLDKPKRSKWNAFWCTSRIKPCVCWCWHKWGIQAVFWILMILLVAVILYGIIENWPYIVGGIIGLFTGGEKKKE